MRIDRLYAITLVLASGDRTTAGALAERFGVSVRTIYRDLEALDLTGVPVVSVQGAEGGVSLMPGYRVEGSYFTRRELEELATTLRGIAPLLSGTSLPSAAEKVTALGHPGLSQEEPSSPVHFDFTSWSSNEILHSAMGELIGAIREEKAVSFDYTSLRPERSHRSVEPLSIVFQGSSWYLSAWCRLRRGYRWFTIARIEKLRRLDSSFNRRARLDAMPRTSAYSEAPVGLKLALTRRGAAQARPYVQADEADFSRNGGIVEVKLNLL